MSSFESELLALVATWRSKGADIQSMMDALAAEQAGLVQHLPIDVAAEKGNDRE